MNLGYALKKIRTERGIRQNVAAKKAGISQTYLSQIESGDKDGVSVDIIKSLSMVYSVPPAVIYWYAMDDNDVQKSKMEAYRKLKPAIDSIVSEFLHLSK